MPGTTLSRWTMSFFATALSFLIGGEVMMVLGYGFPSAEIAAPETLFLVHVIAIGWLSLLMATELRSRPAPVTRWLRNGQGAFAMPRSLPRGG